MAPRGLADRQAPGHPGKLNTAQREALAAMVESGPIPAIHGVISRPASWFRTRSRSWCSRPNARSSTPPRTSGRWRLKDLAMWVWEEFRVWVSETTLSRILRALGYRKLSARPRHHHCCEAWNKLIERPWTIMSIGLRDWANGF